MRLAPASLSIWSERKKDRRVQPFSFARHIREACDYMGTDRDVPLGQGHTELLVLALEPVLVEILGNWSEK